MKKTWFIYVIMIFFHNTFYALQGPDSTAQSTLEMDGFVIIPTNYQITKPVQENMSSHIMEIGGKFIQVFDNYEGNVSTQDLWGDTRLHTAVANEKLQDIVQLLRNGAKPDTANLLGESPLSLMLKKNDVTMQRCFTTYGGCCFVKHIDFFIMSTSIKSLLQDRASKFHTIISKGLHQEGLAGFMSTLQRIFTVAEINSIMPAMETNAISSDQGRIVTIDDIDCLIKIKLSDLTRSFGESIEQVRDIVSSYTVANEFVVKCNSSCYDEARAILTKHTGLCTNSLFNHYIMLKLIANETIECWKLLFDMKFDPNAKPEGGIYSMMYHAAIASNSIALYDLTLHGADYKEENFDGKTPIDLLITRLNYPQLASQAHLCLLSIQNGMNKRKEQLQSKAGYAREIIALIDATDMIARALSRLKR